MCELFGMSARHAATVSLSLEEFSRHGGLTGPHKDGWGIAWYDEGDIRLIKEVHPAATSACVRFLQTNPLSSALVISHVRRATLGPVASRNCQPFVRELGGVWHCFARNGDLPAIASDARFRADSFRPVGDTDSEQAFCALMDALRPLWAPGPAPSLAARTEVVSRFGAALRELGPANFLYCDGDALFAHADRRHQSDGSPDGAPPAATRTGHLSKRTRSLATTRTRARHSPFTSVNLFKSPITHLSPPTTCTRAISLQAIPVTWNSRLCLLPGFNPVNEDGEDTVS